jgi:Agenet domain/Caspase domain
MPEHHRRGWHPERTWVFAVGTLEWKHADTFPPFPQQDRRDAALVEFFATQGVPAAQIVYLQDRAATTRRIQQAFEAQLAQAGADDLLVLYYCGHGGKTDDAAAYFASYDTDCERNQGWLVDSIPATITRCFGGARVLLLADCCYSGSLAAALTGQHKHGAYACLTSSLASELSTGNWTFTEGVLAGLRGQAFVDADGNQQITLQELATQIIDSMAFAEEQIATFAVGGGFDAHMVIAAARTRPDPQVGRRVEVLADGEWYPAQIIDAKGARLQVHYYGYETSDDAWVTGDRIRDAVRTTYPVGTAVEVKWKRSWYPATVLEAHSGIHQIQYRDYGPEWNEWVALKRIRPAG